MKKLIRWLMARGATCPYCKSTDVDIQRGWCECRECGKTWSY